MPDTPGKRQRREVKARKRQAKDDRRAARHSPSDETPTDERADEFAAPLEGQPVGVVPGEPETDGSGSEEVVDP
jgi:hypothetical protein